jgi:hypothetical protein
MGPLGAIRQKIDAVWQNINWNPNKVFYEGKNCVIKIDLGGENDDDPIDCITLALGYSKRLNPYPELEKLCLTYNWSAYDTEIDEFLKFPWPNTGGLKSVRHRAAEIIKKLRRLKRKGLLG